MPKKLHFKGDTGKKKIKRGGGSGLKKESGETRNDAALETTESNSWVIATEAMHINGPAVLLHSGGPSVLNFHATLSRPHMHVLGDGSGSGTPSAPPTLLTYTPTDIASVWVASKLSGTDTLTLRSADGRFLAADRHGCVSALSEARGPNEQWRPVVQQDSTIAWLSSYDKFLAIDEVAGGGVTLRADSHVVGFNESWTVKVQAGYKVAGEREMAREASKLSGSGVQVDLDGVGAASGVDAVPDEATHTSRFQAYGKATANTYTPADKKHLSQAVKQGKLNETLLDRRSKTKSDKFC